MIRLFVPFSACLLGAVAVPSGQFSHRGGHGPLVHPKALEAMISPDELLADSQTLEDFAYSTEERNRVFGSPGHNSTVNYLYDTLVETGAYDVSLQPFVELFSGGTAEFSADGTSYDSSIFTYSPSGSVTGPLVVIPDVGCNADDYADAEGAIALISRGECEFGLKAAYAGAGGAIAAVIYNNEEGTLSGGTLAQPEREEGPYPPSIAIQRADGEALVEMVGSGPVEGEVTVDAIMENRTTYNVLAETKSGDHSSILALGAHSDSVNAGPGINDNGSGSIGILAVAKALAKFSVKHAVRFGWWSAEEFGTLGSEHYVETLPAEEVAKIKLYLNFDMIASPNYIYAIYDGDGSAFNLSGPPGSAEAEHLFESYFESKDLPHTATEFDGRSDYGAFLDAGVASAGLFTGAEDIKTEEEAALFGGEAGVAYDVNYHQAGDNVTNLNMEAFEVNTKAIAFAVGSYASGKMELPAGGNGTSPDKKRWLKEKRKTRLVQRRGVQRRRTKRGPIGAVVSV